MYGAQLRSNGKGQLELVDQVWCDVCGFMDDFGPSSALPLQVRVGSVCRMEKHLNLIILGFTL